MSERAALTLEEKKARWKRDSALFRKRRPTYEAERWKERKATETPEQREARLERKRLDFQKHREKRLATIKKWRDARPGYRSPNERSLERQNYERKRDFVRQLKTGPCMDCGAKHPPYVMQFDHRNPKEKKFAISRYMAIRTTVENLLVEVAKCDLVCANCHAYRTGRARGWK